MPQQNKFRTVGDELGELRKELLDLSLRNSLLNFRQLQGKGLEVGHPRPDLVFRLITKEEKPFGFRVADPYHDEPLEEGDNEFQTQLPKERLETRLLATYRAARTFIEEQGVNTLFLAFGMLRWRDEAEDEFYRAPLVLVPVELERNVRQPFTLSFNGEEIAENVSLIEKIKQEYGLRFPNLPNEDTDLLAYFAEVRGAIHSRDQWSIEADAIALGFFSFAKFLMYRDLDPVTWADGRILLNDPLLNALMGDAPFSDVPSPVNEGAHLDEALRNREPPLVDNADSTQMLALVDALAGRTMVIQGPPGTGKSQTIVNLISASVSAGKKVLFVSEKMAALKVVKHRLDQLGLGASCLELHSNKTKKRELIDELRKTAYGAQINMPGASGELALLGDHRDRLNAYCFVVNEPIGEAGETPASVYGKLLIAEESLENMDLSPIRFVDSLVWTAEDVARRRLLAE